MSENDTHIHKDMDDQRCGDTEVVSTPVQQVEVVTHTTDSEKNLTPPNSQGIDLVNETNTNNPYNLHAESNRNLVDETVVKRNEVNISTNSESYTDNESKTVNSITNLSEDEPKNSSTISITEEKKDILASDVVSEEKKEECDTLMGYREGSGTEDSSSSSSSDDESGPENGFHTGGSSDDSDDEKPNKKRPEKDRKKTSTVRNRGELLLEDLPAIENLQITVDESVKLIDVGTISAVVGVLVIVQGKLDLKPLNAESVLFTEGRKSLGKVFEVFGPVISPLYSVRFNSPEDITERDITVGMTVYYAPHKEEYTKFVFVNQISTKGSDASWENNHEPPVKFLDYSDDEEEKRAKRKGKYKNLTEDTNDGTQEVNQKSWKSKRERYEGYSANQNGSKQRDTSFKSWPPHRSELTGEGNSQFKPPPAPQIFSEPYAPFPQSRQPRGGDSVRPFWPRRSPQQPPHSNQAGRSRGPTPFRGPPPHSWGSDSNNNLSDCDYSYGMFGPPRSFQSPHGNQHSRFGAAHGSAYPHNSYSDSHQQPQSGFENVAGMVPGCMNPPPPHHMTGQNQPRFHNHDGPRYPYHSQNARPYFGGPPRFQGRPSMNGYGPRSRSSSGSTPRQQGSVVDSRLVQHKPDG